MTFYGFIIFGALTLKGCPAEGEWFRLAWVSYPGDRGRNPWPTWGTKLLGKPQREVAAMTDPETEFNDLLSYLWG